MKSPGKLRSCDEAYEYGKSRRDRVPRAEHAEWRPRKDRQDPVEILRTIAKTRVPKLLPIKWQRMALSPFGFFRGAAPVMAADLAGLPHTGVLVQICGDAHVRNLGAYEAPDGRLVFDINDFDETIAAPWEWDIKRLATSLVLARRAARDSDNRCREGVVLFVRTYREFIRRFSEMTILALARYHVHRSLNVSPVLNVLQK